MESTNLHVGYAPQLSVDNCLLECVQGLRRRWHEPAPHGNAPLIERDCAWEQTPYFTYSNYCVIRDPANGLIKCWYEGGFHNNRNIFGGNWLQNTQTGIS